MSDQGDQPEVDYYDSVPVRPGLFRRIPRLGDVVEAVQYSEATADQLTEEFKVGFQMARDNLSITVKEGDWIIKLADGAFAIQAQELFPSYYEPTRKAALLLLKPPPPTVRKWQNPDRAIPRLMEYFALQFDGLLELALETPIEDRELLDLFHHFDAMLATVIRAVRDNAEEDFNAMEFDERRRQREEGKCSTNPE